VPVTRATSSCSSITDFSERYLIAATDFLFVVCRLSFGARSRVSVVYGTRYPWTLRMRVFGAGGRGRYQVSSINLQREKVGGGSINRARADCDLS